MSKIKPSLLQEAINKLVRSGLPITMIRQDKLPTIARLEAERDFSSDVEFWYQLPKVYEADEEMYFCEDTENRFFVMFENGLYWETEATEGYNKEVERTANAVINELFEERMRLRVKMDKRSVWSELAIKSGKYAVVGNDLCYR